MLESQGNFNIEIRIPEIHVKIKQLNIHSMSLKNVSDIFSVHISLKDHNIFL